MKLPSAPKVRTPKLTDENAVNRAASSSGSALRVAAQATGAIAQAVERNKAIDFQVAEEERNREARVSVEQGLTDAQLKFSEGLSVLEAEMKSNEGDIRDYESRANELYQETFGAFGDNLNMRESLIATPRLNNAKVAAVESARARHSALLTERQTALVTDRAQRTANEILTNPDSYEQQVAGMDDYLDSMGTDDQTRGKYRDVMHNSMAVGYLNGLLNNGRADEVLSTLDSGRLDSVISPEAHNQFRRQAMQATNAKQSVGVSTAVENARNVTAAIYDGAANSEAAFEQVRTTLEALRDSGNLTESQTTQVSRELNTLNAAKKVSASFGVARSGNAEEMAAARAELVSDRDAQLNNGDEVLGYKAADEALQRFDQMVQRKMEAVATTPVSYLRSNDPNVAAAWREVELASRNGLSTTSEISAFNHSIVDAQVALGIPRSQVKVVDDTHPIHNDINEAVGSGDPNALYQVAVAAAIEYEGFEQEFLRGLDNPVVANMTHFASMNRTDLTAALAEGSFKQQNLAVLNGLVMTDIKASRPDLAGLLDDDDRETVLALYAARANEEQLATDIVDPELLNSVVTELYGEKVRLTGERSVVPYRGANGHFVDSDSISRQFNSLTPSLLADANETGSVPVYADGDPVDAATIQRLGKFAPADGQQGKYYLILPSSVGAGGSVASDGVALDINKEPFIFDATQIPIPEERIFNMFFGIDT